MTTTTIDLKLLDDLIEENNRLKAKPVAWIETGEVFAGEYGEPDVYLVDEQIDRQINDHAEGKTIRVPLYAAPVQQSLDEEGMRLLREAWYRIGDRELRIAIDAYLAKVRDTVMSTTCWRNHDHRT